MNSLKTGKSTSVLHRYRPQAQSKPSPVRANVPSRRLNASSSMGSPPAASKYLNSVKSEKNSADQVQSNQRTSTYKASKAAPSETTSKILAAKNVFQKGSPSSSGNKSSPVSVKYLSNSNSERTKPAGDQKNQKVPNLRSSLSTKISPTTISAAKRSFNATPAPDNSTNTTSVMTKSQPTPLYSIRKSSKVLAQSSSPTVVKKPSVLPKKTAKVAPLKVKTTGKSFQASTGEPDNDLLNSLVGDFKAGKSVERLELRNMNVDENFVKALTKHLSQVRHIDLSENNLSERTQLMLTINVLATNSVSVLLLEGNDEISKENCDKIASVLPDNHSLTGFRASFASTPKGLKNTLKRNLEIASYTRIIKDAGMIPTARAVTPRDNDLVVRMLQVIDNNPNVKELVVEEDVRFGHLQKSLILDFAESLRGNFHLTCLKITGVELGNTFLSALANSIETNFTLEKLDLSNNNFTSEALLDFCKAMSRNTSLRKVDLRKQHSPVSSQDEPSAISALEKNQIVQSFRMKFKSEKCKEQLQAILDRNAKDALTTVPYNQKLMSYLREEANQAQQLLSERETDIGKENVDFADDWDYLYALSQQADKYKSLDNLYEKEEEKEATPSNRAKKEELEGRLKLESMPADGSFLTNEYISKYLVFDKDVGSLTFEFTNQFRLFKRFQKGDSARRLIVEKFVKTLLGHPQSKDITHLNMANCNCSDDLLEYLSSEMKAKPTLLPKLHLLNLETNCISGPGIKAIAPILVNPESWRFLQVIKLENQTNLLKTDAEVALSAALQINRSVIRLGLRVRNLLERDRIGRYMQRNMDLLRQARQNHAIKTGTKKERSRNSIEKYFDRIASNDPTITRVEIVGDKIFLGLSEEEVIKAGKAFALNTHVTSIKMCNLRLGDDFALALAESISQNRTIACLSLDSNMIGGDGIKAIVSAVANNTSITELQLRHQSKNMPASVEDMIAKLMGGNETVIKMGVDFRNHSARLNLERRIAENTALRRKRGLQKGSPGIPDTVDKIKSVETQGKMEKIKRGDASVTEFILENDKEFMELERNAKMEFYRSLRSNKTLKTLVLNEMQLDNEFADELAAILPSNTTLERISVNGNDFTSAGIFAITLAAVRSKRLRKLSITCPRFKITNEHADQLLREMEKKCYLQELNLEFRDESYTHRVRSLMARNGGSS